MRRRLRRAFPSRFTLQNQRDSAPGARYNRKTFSGRQASGQAALARAGCGAGLEERMPDPNSESPASESSSEPAAKEPLVRATFSVPVAGAFLNASALLPTGRTTLTELLPIVQNIENAIIARVEEEARAAGTPISCRAGCAACCRQMVPVSLFEAEALLEWMQSLPAERQQELAQRFHGALTALRDA